MEGCTVNQRIGHILRGPLLPWRPRIFARGGIASIPFKGVKAVEIREDVGAVRAASPTELCDYPVQRIAACLEVCQHARKVRILIRDGRVNPSRLAMDVLEFLCCALDSPCGPHCLAYKGLAPWLVTDVIARVIEERKFF